MTTREYSNVEFFRNLEQASREALVIAEWIIVLVLFQYAQSLGDNTFIDVGLLVVLLAFSAYATTMTVKLIWWAVPSVKPNAERSIKTILLSLAGLLICWLIFALVGGIAAQLVALELSK